MATKWGDIEWGDLLWGDDAEITPDPFMDLGGNPMALPASSQAVFGELASETESTRIYDAHIKAVRDIDAAGTLFWKRLCAGPELVWAQIEGRMEALTSLYDIDTIEDEFLPFLRLTALWTADTDKLTDKLTASELRQLLAQSPTLWDRRGTTGSYTEILNAIIGVDAFEVDWFDRRWELGVTSVGDNGFDFGAGYLEASDRRVIDIHLADAAREIDRDLVADSLKLWRPSGERINVVFVEMWDRFEDDKNSWVVSTGGGAAASATISEGDMTVPSNSIAYPTAAHLSTKSDYMIRASITPDDLADVFGVFVRHDTDAPDDRIEIQVDPAGLTLDIVQDGSTLAGTTSVDLEAIGIGFVAGYARELRVEVQRVGLTDHFAVWLDGDPVYRFTTNAANDTGTAGILAGSSTSSVCSFFEMIPLPGEVLTVGLSGAITKTY